MKKLLKLIALVMTGVLLATCMTACSETPTPMEIYQKTEYSDNVKIYIVVTIGDSVSAKTVINVDGDIMQMVTRTVAMGTVNEVVNYQQKSGDKFYVYSQDEEGKWTKKESEEQTGTNGLAQFKELFDEKNYKEFDSKSGRYNMKDGLTLKINDIVYRDGYIKVEDKNLYVLYVETDQELSGEKTEGSLKIVLSDYGNIKGLQLPEVK